MKRLCNLYETTFFFKKDIRNPLIFATAVTRRFRRNSGQEVEPCETLIFGTESTTFVGTQLPKLVLYNFNCVAPVQPFTRGAQRWYHKQNTTRRFTRHTTKENNDRALTNFSIGPNPSSLRIERTCSREVDFHY